MTAIKDLNCAQHPDILEFLEQDFTEVPEGQSESLTLANRYLVIVNRDPFPTGQYCITAYNLEADRMVAAKTVPLDDLAPELGTLVEAMADNLTYLPTENAATVEYLHPSLE